MKGVGNMQHLTFYRHKRRDGGIRTAVDVDGITVLHLFKIRGPKNDPALDWWMDLRCKGAKLPRDAEGSRQLLLTHRTVIKEGFAQLAERFEAGMDLEFNPFLWPVPRSPKGVRMTIGLGATRRTEALEMGRILADIGAHWEELIQSLPVAVGIAN
jgi:hypothetical protein